MCSKQLNCAKLNTQKKVGKPQNTGKGMLIKVQYVPSTSHYVAAQVQQQNTC